MPALIINMNFTIGGNGGIKESLYLLSCDRMKAILDESRLIFGKERFSSSGSTDGLNASFNAKYSGKLLIQ